MGQGTGYVDVEGVGQPESNELTVHVPFTEFGTVYRTRVVVPPPGDATVLLGEEEVRRFFGGAATAR